MKFLWIISICTNILFFQNLFAQEIEKPFVFPHKTGDMFQYFCEDGPDWYDTLQIKTVFDSTDSNGIIYMVQTCWLLNPYRPDKEYVSDTVRYWLDTAKQSIYGRSVSTDSTLIIKLDGRKGDVYIDTMNNIAVEIKDKWTSTLWGKEVSFMEHVIYSVGLLEDRSTWLDIYWIDIADGYGVVWRGAGWSYTIMGAVINGTLYGDTTQVTSVNNRASIPETIKLNQNYPNPFNPSTTISFDVKEGRNISLIIYDAAGREIKRLIDNNDYGSGIHEVIWNGLNEYNNPVSSGIYFYRLIAGETISTKSMILMK